MKNAYGLTRLVALAVLCLAAGSLDAQELFSKRVGEVKYGDVKKTDVLEVPYLFWGGDVATFYANGGRETRADSIYGKMGLKLKLVDGDNFHTQVKNYISGQSPFVRGTFSMLGQASEVLNNNAKTKPLIFLQMTWSAGDHMVARGNCKTLNDLKGKKIALQEDGPHVGMLDDVLRTAGLKWKDISVVWTKEVTGKDSPGEKFKADTSIDACFVVTPDMEALTGGLEKTGSGDKTVKGAHVLISTVNMKRSIADLYAVRKDFFDANKPLIEKFVAGYLKGCEELIQIKNKAAAKDKTAQAKYKEALKLAQDIYGKEKLAKEEDADGLVSDAVFVGLPGNRAFFKDKGNPSGFEAKQKHALDLAVGEKYAEARATFLASTFNYKDIAKLADLRTDIDQPPVPLPRDAKLGEAIFTFAITFEPNQKEFSEAKYGEDFKRAVELASLFGNAVITIRGHADTTKVLKEFVEDGLLKKTLTRKGERGNYTYYLKGGKQLDLDDPKNMKIVAALIKKGNDKEGQETLRLCEKLSQDRADRVYDSLLKYASSQKLTLDKNQVKPVGASILEPLVSKPKSNAEAAKNRRVEFRLFKIKGGAPSAEPTETPRYDY